MGVTIEELKKIHGLDDPSKIVYKDWGYPNGPMGEYVPELDKSRQKDKEKEKKQWTF